MGESKNLTKPQRVLAYLPNYICLYRAVASVVALLLGPHPAAPWLFSTALISDLFDGWLYRRYTKFHPKLSRRPYRPYDPNADFVLIICGTLYGALYWLRLGFLGALKLFVLAVAMTVILHVIPYVGPPNRLLFTVCNTIMMHISCLVMVTVTVAAWRANTADWRFPLATIAIFYGIFLLIGDKTRLIRRPPPNWRQ